MKSKSLWTKNYQSVVDNGRNHSMVIDLPEAKGGNNSGPTALEMCVMSLSGCIGTIFALVAAKMRISFDKMEVDLDVEQRENAPTITHVHFVLSIQTEAAKEKVEKCLALTLNTCPVGVLFRQAGVVVTNEIKYL
ncbi:MAG: OsmC family protein [Bacteroidales bacterium]|jgi:putative redox protein|nr:OsmC family protein [Bacteroidales bacterium]